MTFFEYNKKKVYNFEVEEWHTYFVGEYEFLVHNTDPKNCKKITEKVDNLVLGKGERLAKFKEGLQNAPMPKNPDEAIQLINKELNAVEDAFSGVKKNANATSMPNRNDGRCMVFLMINM